MGTSIIKYALSNLTGKPVYIDVVINGLSCNCCCAKCGEKMVAVQGKSENHREWHFRHYLESNCSGGQETVIHKLAKQIIVDNSEISIPNPSETLSYSQGKQEIKLDSFFPDVTVIANGEEIHFEIVVTHPVDKIKEVFYNSKQYKSIEINLTSISYNITPKELEKLVLKTAERRKIFWTIPVIQGFENKKDNLSLSPINSYTTKNEEENWWSKVNPILFFLFIISCAFLLYQGLKLLMNKNRRYRYI